MGYFILKKDIMTEWGNGAFPFPKAWYVAWYSTFCSLIVGIASLLYPLQSLYRSISFDKTVVWRW